MVPGSDVPLAASPARSGSPDGRRAAGTKTAAPPGSGSSGTTTRVDSRARSATWLVGRALRGLSTRTAVTRPGSDHDRRPTRGLVARRIHTPVIKRVFLGSAPSSSRFGDLSPPTATFYLAPLPPPPTRVPPAAPPPIKTRKHLPTTPGTFGTKNRTWDRFSKRRRKGISQNRQSFRRDHGDPPGPIRFHISVVMDIAQQNPRTRGPSISAPTDLKLLRAGLLKRLRTNAGWYHLRPPAWKLPLSYEQGPHA